MADVGGGCGLVVPGVCRGERQTITVSDAERLRSDGDSGMRDCLRLDDD